ncbi:SprT family zinc-dependent metalloprotease [Variovorax rhizosphaerae]|uniref:SprT family zinc-dependent metalloprotease n=1 Tax=Variovorax rhizosphaerae TaxID=1836200 RepID=A0ABU8WCN5_9BURK
MKAHSFAYGDVKIRFEVRRRAERLQQRVAIHVEPDGRVLVDAPQDATDAQVLAAVKKRARWIGRHLDAIGARRALSLPREYLSGESMHYLGRRYRLKVTLRSDEPPGVRLRGGYLEVTAPRHDPTVLRAALDDWYRGRAREVLLQRLASIAATLRWVKTPPPMRLQVMKVQWGSCSPAGRITLNPWLVKAPRECIDYVVLHELCHLLHHNHSARFFAALDRHMPEWRTVKARLDELSEQVLRM